MTAPTILDRIMLDVRREVAEAKAGCPLVELQRRIADAPPIQPMPRALLTGFGLIGEIKERSPSQGPMRARNVASAPAAYEHSPVVRAVSVLTNAAHFGMSIHRLAELRARVTKPILRKDFIYDDYQVYEARAFGADCILLMANLLAGPELQRLYQLAQSLGLEALFECHDLEQVARVPVTAQIIGINSRSFATSSEAYAAARARRAGGARHDFTTDLARFELGRHLPPHVIKVAESGVRPENIAEVKRPGVFHAVLVGTSLLTAEHGIERELERFERALAEGQSPTLS